MANRIDPLNKEIDAIVSLVVNDEQINKLLYYDETDVSLLDKPSLTIAQKKELLNKKIYPRKNVNVVENTSGSYITVRLNTFQPDMQNSAILTHYIEIYILVHNGSIDCFHGQKDLLLLYLINKLINHSNTFNFSKSKTVFVDDVIFDNMDFSGYVARFPVILTNKMES